MMNRGFEILSPPSYSHASNWLFQESKDIKWTRQENKRFENALALYDQQTPDRWFNVAAMIPGKTVADVIKQYRELEEDVSDIEAGWLIPIPGYLTDSFTFNWVNNHTPGGKTGTGTPPCDQERNKGVPWTEDEHRQFLMGLRKYGKGDWRSISRNFVTTTTPTQVASHAQKYFIRQLTGGKDKRRSSIHDVTTLNIANTPSSSPDHGKPSSPKNASAVSGVTNEGAAIVFDQRSSGNALLSPFCKVPSYGPKLDEQNLASGTLPTSQFGSYRGM
ncbi:hypothetical protein V6Z11_D09G185700 [Gossypium hirsutum]